MLTNLHVKNLALIDEAEVEFGPGLNILTGETGAGKSILIGSINAALGKKISREMIRTGETSALVELVFETENPHVLELLKEMDLEAEEGQVIISRKITGSRSVCRINNIDEKDTLKGVLMAMVLYCGMIGFILPWQNTIWLFGGFWQKGSGLEIPAMNVFYCGLIWLVLSIFLCVFVFKFICHFSRFLITEEVAAKYTQTKATTQQKAGIILLAVYIGLLLFANIFKDNLLANLVNALGVVGLSIIYMTIFAIWKKEDGKPVLNVAKCFTATPWPVIMLIAITIPLGDALQSADTGVMGAITAWLMPLISGMSPGMVVTL